jgi:hypothetical protein
MPKPLPPHPNVRNCTHIKVTGQRCGSPALRGEFFCYFHTRVIKGVAQRVDMRLDPMALLEDCESIQLSTMHVVDGLVKGTLDTARARLILEALRMAARNAKNVRFDDVHYRNHEQPMVRQIPNYAQQYLIEHPEFGPPLNSRSLGAPAREAEINLIPANTPPAKTRVARTFLSANPTPAPSSAKRNPPCQACSRPDPKKTQPRSHNRSQPTAQAMAQTQKMTQLRRSERSPPAPQENPPGQKNPAAKRRHMKARRRSAGKQKQKARSPAGTPLPIAKRGN